MVRIRGRIGDWPVDLTVELDPQDWAQLAAAVPSAAAQSPAAVTPAPAQADQDGQWQTVLELLRRADEQRCIDRRRTDSEARPVSPRR